MAQEITGPMFGHFLTPKDMIKEVADQTATVAFAQLGRKARWLFCRIYQKAFVAGTGTVPVQYILEGASDAGFTANLVTVGVGECERADEASTFIIGFSPKTPLAFWRVRQVESGTDAATFDAKLDAVA